jgi:hypothetical protein
VQAAAGRTKVVVGKEERRILRGPGAGRASCMHGSLL